MVKKIVLGLLIIAVIAGAASAQETTNMDLGTMNSFSFNWNETFAGTESFSSFNTSPGLTQLSTGDMPREPWGGSPFIAGWVNTFFGIWSWSHGDFLGGGVTVGLYAIGAGMMAFAATRPLRRDTRGGWVARYYVPTSTYVAWVIGGLFFTGGSIFAYVRGATLYNRMMRVYLEARQAISSTPLANASLAILPTFDNRRVMGSLTYSLSF